MHLYAFAIYGVCIAGYECSVFWENLKIKRQVRISLLRILFGAAVSLLVPLLATTGLQPGVQQSRTDGLGPNLGTTNVLAFNVKWKVEGLVSPIYFHNLFEKPLLLILAILLER